MKRSLIGLAASLSLLSAPSSVVAQEAQAESLDTQIAQVCAEISGAFDGLRSVLPMQVDDTTTIIAMDAEMGGDEYCQTSYIYDVNEDAFVAGIVKASEGNLTETQAMNFLLTPEGRNFVASSMKKFSMSTFEQMGLMRDGIRFDMTYNFQGGELEPILISF